ncbi:MAG TPA: hypothetical protein VM687_09530 [Stenotrophomonas sp.]|nr:hypothetical protein [Stenotrophomonas sp.]
MNVVKSNRKCIVPLVLVAVLATGSTYALMAFNRGTYYCDHCMLQTPDADSGTAEFIRKIRAPISKVPLFDFVTGSKYTVCNPMYCATYEEQFNGTYLASDPAKRRTISPGQRPKGVILIEPPPGQPPAPNPALIPSPRPVGPPQGARVCVKGPGGITKCDLRPH